ncbi:hypothetical protein J3E69DRAFT_341771 [Trichoderma sp. SZMC 28015]
MYSKPACNPWLHVACQIGPWPHPTCSKRRHRVFCQLLLWLRNIRVCSKSGVPWPFPCAQPGLPSVPLSCTASPSVNQRLTRAQSIRTAMQRNNGRY